MHNHGAKEVPQGKVAVESVIVMSTVIDGLSPSVYFWQYYTSKMVVHSDQQFQKRNQITSDISEGDPQLNNVFVLVHP